MTAGIVKMIPPTYKAENIQEDSIEPLRPKDSAVTKLMGSYSLTESSNCTVYKERCGKTNPQFLGPKKIRCSTGENKEYQVASRLIPSL